MELTPARVLGSICPKHPELNGLRRKKTRECMGCIYARNNQRKKRPQALEKLYAKRRDQREAGKVASNIAKAAYEAVRLRACALASQRVQDVSRWREFWTEALESDA